MDKSENSRVNWRVVGAWGWFLVLALIILCANLRVADWFFVSIRRIPYADKVGHFVLVGIMALLTNAAMSWRRATLFPQGFFKGSLLVASAVALEELTQLFLLHRSFCLLDLTADFLGIMSADVWGRFRLRRHDTR